MEKLDEILVTGLSQEGKLRLKSVDMAITFFKDKGMADPKTFQETFEKIYKFVNNLENGK